MTEESVLETLRRVDDRIILAVMGRDLNLDHPNLCLCGWALREKLAELLNVGASEIMSRGDGTPAACAHYFAGTEEEWRDIFLGVVSWGDAEELRIVESAWAQRVDEAVFPAQRRSSRRRVSL